MIDPSLPLQGAIVVAMKASTAVRALIGNPARVYDRVPDKYDLPYVTVGEGIVIPEKADCLDAAQIMPVIRCFSEKPGYTEVKQIASAIVSLLDENETITITGHRIVSIELEDLRYRRDADGLTSIADVTLRVMTEPTA